MPIRVLSRWKTYKKGGSRAALSLPGAAQALLMLGGVLLAMLLLGYGFHALFEWPFMSQSSSRMRRQSQIEP